MGKFEIYKDKYENFRFKFGVNDQTILRSEGYNNKSDCKNGILLIKNSLAIDSRYDYLVTSKGRKPYFVIKSFNGQVIATSESSSSVEEMKNRILLVRSYASDSVIREID